MLYCYIAILLYCYFVVYLMVGYGKMPGEALCAGMGGRELGKGVEE